MKSPKKNNIISVYNKFPDCYSDIKFLHICYLIDWKNILAYKDYILTDDWEYSWFGPYSNNIINIIQGRKKKNKYPSGKLEEIYNIVYKRWEKKTPQERTILVYSTYPMATHYFYDNLDLKKCRKKYKKADMPSKKNPFIL